LEAGIGNVVPIYGVNGLTEDHGELVRRFGVESVALGLDADDAGKEKTPEVVAALESLGVTVRILEWPEKDPNELLVKHGPEKTRQIVEELLAPPAVAFVNRAITSPSLIAVPAEGESPASAAATADAIKEESQASQARSRDELTLRSGSRSYEVRGVREARKSATSLRVRVKLVAGEAKVIDAVDLYSARSRGVFLAHAVEAKAGERGEVERDLTELVERIELAVAEQATKPGQSCPIVVEPTAAERAEALAFLRRPDLSDAIVSDMTALGYVGEETNKQIGYLVAISRKLPEPLSMILMSPSGAGKSALAGVLEQLTPPEDVILFSRLTPQALFYMERDALQRKFIVIEERAGSLEADYSIRILQSKKRLVLALPVKDPATGKTQTQVFEILGPAAFFESTTESRLNPENASRCFEGYCDESEVQTRRIHEAQKHAKTAQGGKLLGEREAIVRRHHNAQRLLETVRVEIPYAPLLSFPSAWLRTRRDHLRFLNLIEAIAFLYQHQRERRTEASGGIVIEATVEDYERAYGLAAELLTQTLSDVKRPALEFYGRVRALSERRAAGSRKRLEEVLLTRREIREETGLPDHRVRALLSDLVELEHLEIVAGAIGRTFRYRLSTLSPRPSEKLLAGLLTPEELRRATSPAASRNAPRGFCEVASG
jgi:hypothetical protein